MRTARWKNGLGAGVVLTSFIAACASPGAPSTTTAEPSTSETTDDASAAAVLGGTVGTAGAKLANVFAPLANVSTVVQIAAEATPPAARPGPRWIGRFDTSDPRGPVVAWPGARVILRFDGTEASVRLDERPGMPEVDGPSMYDVIVDGDVQGSPLVTQYGEHDYAIARDLPAGEHILELYRRTEARVGITQFLGFDVGAGTVLAPPPEATRRIEFLGDSASAGYGTLGDGPSCDFSAATQSSRLAFPGVTAEILGADHQSLSYSGKGISQNYDRTTVDVFGDIYGRTLPDTATALWDFSAFVPEVVWVMLGANDWDIPYGGAPAPDVAVFESRYDALIGLVRGAHPKAHVFCSLTPSLSDDWPGGYFAYSNNRSTLESVVARRKAKGDARIYYFEFARTRPGELTGCNAHANPALHRKMADQIVAAVRAVTGW